MTEAKTTAKNGMNSSEINSTTGTGSKWAADMQTHFAQTGSYRSEDLRRVLGDPLSGISLSTHNPAGRQVKVFAHGEDRLVRPNVQGPGTRPIEKVDQTSEESGKHNGGGNGGGTGNGGGNANQGSQELPFFVRGLLKSLPPEDTDWSSEDRVKWLEAAAKCFDLMYGGGQRKITIAIEKDKTIN